MGIKTSTGTGGALFYKINAKLGCFQQGSGANKVHFEPGRTALEGILIGAKIDENEYEGVKSEELRMIFRDTEAGQPNLHVSMGITNDGNPSAFAIRALAKINSASFGEVISLTPYLIEAGTKLGEITFDKDTSGVSVKQNGQKLVEDLGTPDNKLPERPTVMANNKPVMVNGRELKDSSAWGPILDAQLAKMFDRLGGPQETVSETDGVSVDDVAAGAAAAAQAPRARG